MRDQQPQNFDEGGVRALLDERARAIHEKDAAALVNAVLPEMVLYDALDSLQRQGQDDDRAKTEQWLNWYDGPIEYETRNLVIVGSGDIAYCHFLYRITGMMKTGTPVDMWVRTTLGLQRIGGVWRIGHEHASVPFDAESGQALVALTP